MARRDTPWRAGLVQVYTGPGKGKTTAAFGLALRAAGQGARVLICQFMKEKGPVSGETRAMAGVEAVEVRAFGDSPIRAGHDSDERIRADVEAGLVLAEDVLHAAAYDLVVLDEIIVAVEVGMVSEERLRRVMEARTPGVELVLTGRGASAALIEAADLVTEFVAVKHPFDRGTPVRRGIEY